MDESQFKRMCAKYNLKLESLIDILLYPLKKRLFGTRRVQLRRLEKILPRLQSRYFDGFSWNFQGIKLPYDKCYPASIFPAFLDVMLVYCEYKDNYAPSLLDKLEPAMYDGVYCYQDSKFDVTIKPNDIVLDAGAWIGDFSAYAAIKGAVCYAFEPVKETFELLKLTKTLNSVDDDSKIIPVRKGLSDVEGNVTIYKASATSEGASIFNKEGDLIETIALTTIDKFVEENKLTKVDFIKTDIEGAERYMLRGAEKTLKNFAPKLSICTYHYPEDPQLLEKIILEINPNYTIVHRKRKLFAMVIT